MREKHGRYNAEKHLPDNRMQATGSGTDVWLNACVLFILGEQGQVLIAQSVVQKEKRYLWLCEQLIQLGHEVVVQEYRQRQRDAGASRRLCEKQRRLEALQERLANTPESDRVSRDAIQREIAKTQKYISERSRAT